MELKDYVYSLARKRRSIRKYRSDPIDLGDVLYTISTAIQARLELISSLGDLF